MMGAVQQLSVAAYFCNSTAHACQFFTDRAALLLRVWFLNQETAMLPNLFFGQIQPSKTLPRPGHGGFIEWTAIAAMLDAVTLLDATDEAQISWTAQDRAGFKRWIQDFEVYVSGSAARGERDMTNNHGSWFDVDWMGVAGFAGNTTTAIVAAEEVKTRRVAMQVTANGTQWIEVERTNSVSYCIYNLVALTRAADMAASFGAGVDVWSYVAPTSAGGGSLRAAIDFMIPYVRDNKTWPYPQMRAPDYVDLIEPLRRASRAYRNRTYEQILCTLQTPRAGVCNTHLDLLNPPVFKMTAQCKTDDSAMTHDDERVVLPANLTVHTLLSRVQATSDGGAMARGADDQKLHLSDVHGADVPAFTSKYAVDLAPRYHLNNGAHFQNDPSASIFLNVNGTLQWFVFPDHNNPDAQGRSRVFTSLDGVHWVRRDTTLTWIYTGGVTVTPDGIARAIHNADYVLCDTKTDPWLVNWSKAQFVSPCLPPSCAKKAGGAPPLPHTGARPDIFRIGDPARPFQFRGDYYLVMGVGTNGSKSDGSAGGMRGEAWLYKAQNKELTSWSYVSVLFSTNVSAGHWWSQPTNMLECPDMFQLGHKWVSQIMEGARTRAAATLTTTSGTSAILMDKCSQQRRKACSTGA
jgi:hypothetical protein